MQRARTIKRLVESEQFGISVLQECKGLPWDPKESGEYDPSLTLPLKFVFPLTVSNSSIESAPQFNLEFPAPSSSSTGGMMPRHRAKRKSPPVHDEPMSLESHVKGTKRSVEVELPDEDLPSARYLRVSIVQSDGSSSELFVNEEKLQPNIEPQDEFPERFLQEGINREMDSLHSFNTYVQVPLQNLSVQERNRIIGSRFVNRWKGDAVKSRLVVQAYRQVIDDRGEIFAATPLFASLKLLLILAFVFHWNIVGYDVNTAFLHASLPEQERVHIWPPKEFASPDNSVVWLLLKSLYGLRTSPHGWQSHISQIFRQIGLIEFKSEGSVWRSISSDFFPADLCG